MVFLPIRFAVRRLNRRVRHHSRADRLDLRSVRSRIRVGGHYNSKRLLDNCNEDPSKRASGVQLACSNRQNPLLECQTRGGDVQEALVHAGSALTA